MKRILIASVAVCLLLAGGVQAADRIVFVDLEQLFNEFYKTQLAKSRVETQQKDIEAEKQIMVDEMELLSEQVDTLRREARDTTLTQEIRDSKRLLFEERLLEMREKQKEIEEFNELRTKQLQVQVSRMSQTIMDEIRQTIVEYAQEEGFQAVIDSSNRRAAVGVFLYTRPDVDITARVLTILNSKRPDEFDLDELFDEAATNRIDADAGTGEPSSQGTDLL